MLTLAAYHFSAFALPDLLVAVAVLLWGLLLYWRESDAVAGKWALGVAVAVATWQTAFAAGYLSDSAALAQQWIVIGQAGVIFIGPTLYELLRHLLGMSGWRNRLSPVLWAVACAFLYTLLGTDRYLAGPYHFPWGYFPHYEIGGALLAIWLCLTFVFLFSECWRTWRASPRGSGRRHRARILWIGFGVGFAGAVDFLPCLGIAVYPFGYLMVAFTITTIGYAAWRYQVVSVTSRAAAEQVLKTLSDGVLVLDDMGAITVANDRAALLLGIDRNELMGRTVDEIAPLANCRVSGAADDFTRSEITVSAGNGGTRILDVTVSTMRGAHNEIPLVVYVLQDVTRHHEAADRIRKLIYFDQPTGLPNRRHFADKLDQALRHAPRDQSIAVCGIRLKHLRHLAEDRAGAAKSVLNEIAARLRVFADTAPPGSVTVARIESHEFALFVERADSVGAIIAQLNRLDKILHEPVTAGARRIQPVLWLGVSLFPNDGNSTERLMERAAAAVDQAADAYSEHVHFFDADANAAALRTLALNARLARGIETDQLRLFFQPVIDIGSGAVECGEALVRWQDEHGTLHLPDEFIPVAEHSGLIVALDRWVLKSACEQAARWQHDEGGRAPRVAVNISGAHLSSAGGARIVETIAALLDASGLPPDRLEIEITETRLAKTDAAVVEQLRRLRETGVRIAVDDFGTGYASLNYLQRLPLDKLKVDRSFVVAIGEDRTRTALLESILLLASQLGLDVVAEGVETPRQLEFLRRHNCRLIQGFLFSPPLPANEFARYRAGDVAVPTVARQPV